MGFCEFQAVKFSHVRENDKDVREINIHLAEVLYGTPGLSYVNLLYYMQCSSHYMQCFFITVVLLSLYVLFIMLYTVLLSLYAVCLSLYAVVLLTYVVLIIIK